MTPPLALDAATGRIEAFGAVIDADSRADDLPPRFLKTWQMVTVEGRQVECVLAASLIAVLVATLLTQYRVRMKK